MISVTTGRPNASRRSITFRSPSCSSARRRFTASITIPTHVQRCTLLSIKTGGCPEDCAYCPQSAHYETGVARDGLMDPRRRAGGRAHGARQRIDALLHGRGVARSARRRGVRRGARHGAGCGGARHGSVHDARHADGRAGAAAEVGRPHRLQPQPRHVGGVLSADHHHAHVSGSARHASARAGGGAQRLLRRHHRHGGVVARSLRDARAARPARSASGEPAGERARAHGRHAARRCRRSRSDRARPHGRVCAARRAEGARAAVGRTARAV